ncbi:MAG TPA: hypothetical protein VHD63_20250 [Ktedonobacteraceae bacterium]|nr:hypothetical protein [Ktedonobacteraceae bacterium]
MSQQHAQFEEEFRDGPQPHMTYQEHHDAPSVTYTAPVPPVPPPLSYMGVPAQKLQAPVQQNKQGGTGIGVRVVLAIFSLFFVFTMFIVSLVIASNNNPVQSVLGVLAILFALGFAVVVLLINLIVNLRR